MLELYSHLPPKPSRTESERKANAFGTSFWNENEARDARHVFKRPAIAEEGEKKTLFGQTDTRGQILIIGGLSRYEDDMTKNNKKFFRRSDVLSFDPVTNSTILLQKLPQARNGYSILHLFDFQTLLFSPLGAEKY